MSAQRIWVRCKLPLQKNHQPNLREASEAPSRVRVKIMGQLTTETLSTLGFGFNPHKILSNNHEKPYEKIHWSPHPQQTVDGIKKKIRLFCFNSYFSCLTFFQKIDQFTKKDLREIPGSPLRCLIQGPFRPWRRSFPPTTRPVSSIPGGKSRVIMDDGNWWDMYDYWIWMGYS